MEAARCRFPASISMRRIAGVLAAEQISDLDLAL
jgi:hypothetical protein